MFLMYAAILFLYYYNDLTGAVLTTLSFFGVTLLGSIFSMRILTEIWYGLGVVLGSFVGWTVAYMRLRRVEKNIDIHIFCKGTLLKQENGPRPTGLVYQADSEKTQGMDRS